MVRAKAEELFEIRREEQKAIEQSLSEKVQQQSYGVGDPVQDFKSAVEELKQLHENIGVLNIFLNNSLM